jgi:hypothetical protein
MMEMVGFTELTEIGHDSFAATYFGIEAVIRSKVVKWKVNMQTNQERQFCMQDNEAILLDLVME